MRVEIQLKYQFFFCFILLLFVCFFNWEFLHDHSLVILEFPKQNKQNSGHFGDTVVFPRQQWKTFVFAGYHVGVSNQSCGSWTLFLCDIFLRRTFPIELLDKKKIRGRGRKPLPSPSSFTLVQLFRRSRLETVVMQAILVCSSTWQLRRCLYLHTMNYNCMLWGNANFSLSLLSPTPIITQFFATFLNSASVMTFRIFTRNTNFKW